MNKTMQPTTGAANHPAGTVADLLREAGGMFGDAYDRFEEIEIVMSHASDLASRDELLPWNVDVLARAVMRLAKSAKSDFNEASERFLAEAPRHG